MQEFFLEWRYFERELSKSLKKVNFFFQTQSFLMDRIIKNKRGLELATSRSSGYEASSKILLYSLYIIWPSLMINVKQFLSYSKNYIYKFMQVSWWHHNFFHFHLPFSIWKMWTGREKITKNWICREQKEFLRWNKKHFS